MTNENKAAMQLDQAGKIPCPVCGRDIPVSLRKILEGAVTCPYCDTKMTVNRKESQTAISLLQKIVDASDNLDSKSVFRK